MAVTAKRVQQLLGWRGAVKAAPRPVELPDETETRLALDETVLMKPPDRQPPVAP